MRIHWSQLVGFLLLVALAGCVRADNEEIPVRADYENALDPCPITSPNVTVVRHSSRFNYGNGEQWTYLPPDGTVLFSARGPGFVNPDGSLSRKWHWYVEQEDFHGELEIEGRRLDAPSERSVSGNHSPVLGDPGFHAGKLTFPSEGCWEVTGKVGDSNLTFVVRVIKGRTLKDGA